MHPGFCPMCERELSPRNPGLICQICQEKLVYERASLYQSRNLDVEDMRIIFGLSTQEQVKRLGRKGKLPPRIPAIKRWLWLEEVVRDWIRSYYEISAVVKEKVNYLIEAHGGAHKDENTGKTVYGDKVDIQVMVYSKKGKEIVRETRKVSTVLPPHYE